MISWSWQSFADIESAALYQVLRLRQAVFVVEQTCAFADIDGLDLKAWHLSGRLESGELIAYLRVLAPGVSYPEPSIGRVVTDPGHRGRGIGRVLMTEGLRRVRAAYPEHDIKIGAQRRLQAFYQSLGFESVGQAYLEDGIMHIAMLLSAGLDPPSP